MNDDAAHDGPMDVDALATPPEPALYWTACFLVSQCFGGQAEGGWWFNQGELVTTPDIYRTLGAALCSSYTSQEREVQSAR